MFLFTGTQIQVKFVQSVNRQRNVSAHSLEAGMKLALSEGHHSALKNKFSLRRQRHKINIYYICIIISDITIKFTVNKKMDFIFYRCTITELAKAFSKQVFDLVYLPVSTSRGGLQLLNLARIRRSVITSHIHSNIRFGSKTIFIFFVSLKLTAIVNAISIT